MIEFASLRKDMVESQIAARGVRDPQVLAAMRRVPRELFLPESDGYRAYRDRPLPIGAGQTISQPYIVAYMAEALLLRRGDKVLEVGAGSGYAAAVLAQIAGKVFAIERIPELVEMARHNLEAAQVGNVELRCGDGTLGWPEEAPFDAILVSAGAPEMPRTLMKQLRIGGRMVVPVGHTIWDQTLLRIRRKGEDRFHDETLAPVRFVPLVGKEGFAEEPPPRSKASGG